MQQWNFGVEYPLLQHGVLKVTYAGAKGTHLYLQGAALFRTTTSTSFPISTIRWALPCSILSPIPSTGKAPPTAGTLGAATIAQGFLLKPYPQFQQVQVVAPTKGFSTYNALQSSYQYRMPEQGELLVSYTWAKILSNTDSIINFLDPAPTGAVQDFDNLSAEKSLSSYDVPQNVVLSYSSPLPFGSQEKYFSNTRGFAGGLISGWRASGITTFQAGTPLAFNSIAPTDLSELFGAGTIRPNVVPGCSLSVSGSAASRLNQRLNTSCFTSPGPFSFGDERWTDGRIRTQGIDNWDFSLDKTTSLTERLGLRFDAQAFNIFNRVQFGAPVTSVGSPLLGVVSSQVNQPRTLQFAARLSFKTRNPIRCAPRLCCSSPLGSERRS